MSRVFKNKTGLTMVEVLVSTLLIGVVFLGVSSLYLASRKLYITASERAIIGYEVQYASQHIYKNVMRAIGDESSPPATSAIDVPNAEWVDLRINSNDPLTRANYSTVTTYSYYKSGNTLIFDNGVTTESLIPKVVVTAVNFTKSGDTLTASITASFGSQTQTFYFACYPRLGTFH